MNNKRIGNSFEKEYAEMLKVKGFWAMLVTPKKYIQSQPMDIVAAKDNKIYCFECKTLHSKNNRFNIGRIEFNQRLSWERLKETGNTNYFLIVLFNDKDIYKIPFTDINFKEKYIVLNKKYKEGELIERNMEGYKRL